MVNTARGGKTVYGASLGILMLETRFPRIPGDIGHAQTWPFPVQYRIVTAATPDRVVQSGADGLLDAFISAGHDLVAQGVDGITTSCGFLVMMQEELSRALPVPVLTSSLMQVEMVNRLLPRCKRAGILTIAASALTTEHLVTARVPAGTPIGTTEGGSEFTSAILGDAPTLDIDAARADNIAAALQLQQANPDLGAIILECTNMSPYAADIRHATGLPVFTIIDAATWFHAGLSPRRYPTA
ncbi:aspartate/glutamate racemase family protein [Actibacterium sp. 188UL27-1]|uniref:aspartate/glutamate racemase family protein n=1 Tax=Actibacterium sp. 188UL27-1 TaxID=2786961 RepID=UPI00195B09AA|nr:aspartate/glutamate racemase family protein [Actibacterium sp. 188UL27-1]MBM7067124.1 aspartate/glutamate racemase family protein [Actibacterium sp. 188UL27-1]